MFATQPLFEYTENECILIDAAHLIKHPHLIDSFPDDKYWDGYMTRVLAIALRKSIEIYDGLVLGDYRTIVLGSDEITDFIHYIIKGGKEKCRAYLIDTEECFQIYSSFDDFDEVTTDEGVEMRPRSERAYYIEKGTKRQCDNDTHSCPKRKCVATDMDMTE